MKLHICVNSIIQYILRAKPPKKKKAVEEKVEKEEEKFNFPETCRKFCKKSSRRCRQEEKTRGKTNCFDL